MAAMENEVAALRTKVAELEAQLAARDAEIAQLKGEGKVERVWVYAHGFDNEFYFETCNLQNLSQILLKFTRFSTGNIDWTRL